MAYGVKYQLLCKDRDGITSKVVISEDGYAGAEIDRNVPRNAFGLRKDRADIIQGTSLEFLIREVVDFEFLAFYTNNPKKYKVEFYWPSTTLIWSGYLNPQQYEVEYKPGPSNIRLQATDGLGLLKEERFNLVGYQDQLAILRHCLDKIGLNLSYAIGINIWEISHDGSRSPLEQTADNCSMFAGWTCYDVLEAILSKYDATITQNDNRWEILSYKDKKSARMIYTSAGVYSSLEAAPPLLNLATTRAGLNVRPVGHLNLSLLAGGKSVELSSDYGLRPSILDNYKFDEYESLAFRYWSMSGSFSVGQRRLNDDYFAYLTGFSNVDTDYIYQSVPIVRSTGQLFSFSINVCPVGWSLFTGSFTSISMTVRVQVRLAVGAVTYYLTSLGWSTTPGYISETLNSATSYSAVAWTKIAIQTAEIPESGMLTVQLHRIKSSGFGSNVGSIGVAFALPSPMFSYQNESIITGFEDVANFTGSSEPARLSEIELFGADVPTYPNATRFYDRCMRHLDNTPTVAWRMEQADTAYTLLGALAKMLASRNQTARQQLMGSIRGASVNFSSLIRHVYNNNREFEISECFWDVFEGVLTVTLLEFMPYTSRGVVFDSGASLGNAADLTVSTVTGPAGTLSLSQPSDAIARVVNTGDSTGCQTIEWKVVNGSDVTQSSGSVTSGLVSASGYVDRAIPFTAPAAAGTYYMKCKISTDTTWISSAAITVTAAPVIQINSVATISDGTPSDPLTVSISITNNGAAGTINIAWIIVDVHDNMLTNGSTSVYATSGTANYNISGVYYPSPATLNCMLKVTHDSLTWVGSNYFDSI